MTLTVEEKLDLLLRRVESLENFVCGLDFVLCAVLDARRYWQAPQRHSNH